MFVIIDESVTTHNYWEVGTHGVDEVIDEGTWVLGNHVFETANDAADFFNNRFKGLGWNDLAGNGNAYAAEDRDDEDYADEEEERCGAYYRIEHRCKLCAVTKWPEN